MTNPLHNAINNVVPAFGNQPGLAAGEAIVATETGNFNLSTAANYILINSAAGITITLPNPATVGDFAWHFLLRRDNPGTVLLSRFGAETIQGLAADYTIPATPWSAWHFVCDGTNWWFFND